jgi:hypothetical protein
VKIIIDEENDSTVLMSTKPMEKDCEVFLVDHAWTFKFQDAFTTLNTNQALMERLKKIIEHKHKLPIA